MIVSPMACRLQKALVHPAARSYSRTGSVPPHVGGAGPPEAVRLKQGTCYQSPLREREVFSMTVTAARPMRSAPIIQPLPLYRTGPA